MRIRLLIILLFLNCIANAQSTFSVSGTVVNAKGETLPAVTLFITNTKKITRSDEKGEFRINELTPGAYELIVKTLGYETLTQPINLQRNLKLKVILEESVVALNEVVIKIPPDPDRPTYLRLFERYFLGSDANAAKCKILNPEVLRFRYNRKEDGLDASTGEFLLIENQALGYKVSYNIDQLHIDIKDQRLSYYGSFYFEDLPGTDEQKKEWEHNRQIAYRGSARHFFKSAFNNTAEAEGFSVYKLPDEKKLRSLKKEELAGIKPVKAASLLSELTKDAKLLKIDTALNAGKFYVIYDRESEPASTNLSYLGIAQNTVLDFPLRITARQKKQISLLSPLTDSILVDPNGVLAPPKNLLREGYWASERIADLVPIDYTDSSPADINAAAPETVPAPVKAIIASVDTLRNRIPTEKLYMQFDKPYYSTGDTIWFKTYLFAADFLKGSQESGIVYIELANDTNKVLLQRMLPVANGIGWGNIVLDKDDVPEGSYTIHAYTNLMRNFGEDLIFKKNFYVSGNGLQNWLVASNIHLFKQGVKDSIRMALQFNRLDKQILGLRDMELRVMEGRRTLFRDKVQTAGDGSLDLNFSLPEKTDARKITLIASDLTKGQEHKAVIPIPVNRPENLDLQFMPEGGNLVSGIASKIGFKALSEDGLGTIAAGKIYSNNNELITEFKSEHKGMGSFSITPKAGENYVAKIVLPDGTVKSYALPEVKSTGTTLSVHNFNQSDSLEIAVIIPPQSAAPSTYLLIGQSRGIVCYGAVIRSSGQRKIAKSLFPTGITKFSLLTSEKQPLNERITFIDHHDNLDIKLSTQQSSYKIHDSISVDIEVKDHEGYPVQASFSLAITDDSQVKTDSTLSNIQTSLLLTSDLKGNVEEPGHYFQKTDQAWADLDNLLLTQGWRGYSWKDIFSPPQLEYAAEKELIVKGRVSNVFSKSIGSTSIMLLSSRPPFLRDTLTNKDGTFTFSGFPLVDTLTFQLQARNKNDKSFNVGIDMEEFKSPVFKPSNNQFMPWYVNTDTTLLQYIHSAAVQKQEQIKLETGGNVLSEVTITTKRVIKDSHNLNGDGVSDITLDEKDMVKAKKTTLFEILEKRITGFHKAYDHEVRTFRTDKTREKAYEGTGGPEYQDYSLYAAESRRPVKLVIDGVYIVNSRKDAFINQQDNLFMDYLTAEDIKGIEIMSSGVNLWRYFNNDPTRYKGQYVGIMGSAAIYVEVTTWSGHGAYMQKTPGTYFYRSIPLAGREQFYRPKYQVKSPVTLTDLRSTIHWAPNIITNGNGKASVSFYAADKAGTYSIIIEGSDMNGNIGRKTGVITIK